MRRNLGSVDWLGMCMRAIGETGRLMCAQLSNRLCGISTQTGQTLLHYACSLGQIDIVIYLINRHDCRILEQEHVSSVPNLIFDYTTLMCITACYSYTDILHCTLHVSTTRQG